MEAMAQFHTVAFVNARDARLPAAQGEVRLRSSFLPRRLAKARCASFHNDHKIRKNIRSEHPKSAEVIRSESGQSDDQAELVSHVASESAVESGDKVHQQAEREAAPIASETGDPLQKIARRLEHQAEKASDQEAEHLKSADDSLDSIARKAQDGWGAAVEAVQKRAQSLAEAAEDASGKGNQVVEAAKRGIDDLKQRFEVIQKNIDNSNLNPVGESEMNLSGKGNEVVEAAKRGIDDLKQRFEVIQKNIGNSNLNPVGESEVNLSEGMSGEDAEKHRAVDSEDVNTDGAEVLARQRQQEEEDADAVARTVREFVDPVLESVQAESEDEIGDNNQHLKDVSDQVAHDAYAPVPDHGRSEK